MTESRCGLDRGPVRLRRMSERAQECGEVQNRPLAVPPEASGSDDDMEIECGGVFSELKQPREA